MKFGSPIARRAEFVIMITQDLGAYAPIGPTAIVTFEPVVLGKSDPGIHAIQDLTIRGIYDDQNRRVRSRPPSSKAYGRYLLCRRRTATSGLERHTQVRSAQVCAFLQDYAFSGIDFASIRLGYGCTDDRYNHTLKVNSISSR
jgi:hypothetical protein